MAQIQFAAGTIRKPDEPRDCLESAVVPRFAALGRPAAARSAQTHRAAASALVWVRAQLFTGCARAVFRAAIAADVSGAGSPARLLSRPALLGAPCASRQQRRQLPRRRLVASFRFVAPSGTQITVRGRRARCARPAPHPVKDRNPLGRFELESIPLRKGGILLVEIASELCRNHVNILDASGEDAIAEFKEEPARHEDVMLDGASAPGAAVDGHAAGGHAATIEPAAPDPVVAITQRPNGIARVARGDDHAVAAAQIRLANFFEGTGVLGEGFERVCDSSQNTVLQAPILPARGEAVNGAMEWCSGKASGERVRDRRRIYLRY